MRRFVLVFMLAASLAPVSAALANPVVRGLVPVPSHTPLATQRLWNRLVHTRHRRAAGTADCAALRAVFYTEDDWLRLATKLAANASPCAQYYISIPPLAADKTSFRTDQAWRIRALGTNFHAVAEINYNGWSSWTTANNASFYDAGVEARKRMAAAGFDVAAGDTWAVNEFSSAVRAGTNVARQKVRDLVRGLYTGDGTLPVVKGIVFDIGIDQSTANLAPYKVALQSWYQDSAFWQDMSAYVSDWSQELYGDVRDEAVPGAPPGARIQHLNAYFGHQLALAEAGPTAAAAARAFLEQADDPLANAAWMWSSGFGYTNVPVDQMEDYVTAEVAALRSAGRSRFGFAWAPRMADGSAWTAQFTSDSGALIDRLAAAIHDSDSTPTGACGTTWCTAGLDGAAFTDAWSTFSTWSPTTVVFAGPPVSLAQGEASPPISVQLQTDGVAQTALTPTDVTLSSSSSAGTFSSSPTGPWTPTLTLTIPVGSTGATVYYEDGTAGTPTISAGTATQVETVTPAQPAPTPTPPAPTPQPPGPEPPAAQPPANPVPGGPSGGSGGVPPNLHVQLTADSTTAPPAGSQLVYHVAVTTTNAGSASSAQLRVDLPAGYAVTRTYADRGSGCTAAAQTLTCDLAWISPTVGTTVTIWGTVSASGELDTTATATSLVEPEADPSDNTATLRLAAPPTTAPAPTSTPAPTHDVVPRLLRAPKLVASHTSLRVVPPLWTRPASHRVYTWQLCSSRCTTIGAAHAATLRLLPAYTGRRIRVVVGALVTQHHVVAVSALRRIR